MRPSSIALHAVLLSLGLASLAAAQHAPAKPFGKDDVLPSDAWTPAEKYARGMRTSGVFDVRDPLRCSVEAFRRARGGPPLPKQTLIYEVATRRTTSIDAQVRDATGKLTRVMTDMVANGDSAIAGRHVCVAYKFLKVPNAVSDLRGYIVVDPRALDELRDVVGASPFVDEYIYFHEFGHQLQFWFDRRYARDPTVRRLELQADCAAGSLGVITRINRDAQGKVDELVPFVQVVASGAKALGDFQFEDVQHHGTPLEREASIAAGALMVMKEAMAVANPDNPIGVVGRTLGFYTATLTSRKVLDLCADYINRMDALQGTRWQRAIEP